MKKIVFLISMCLITTLAAFNVHAETPNHLDGVKIGVVTNILVTHLSVGQTNQQWEINKKLFEDKYAGKLPVTI